MQIKIKNKTIQIPNWMQNTIIKYHRILNHMGILIPTTSLSEEQLWTMCFDNAIDVDHRLLIRAPFGADRKPKAYNVDINIDVEDDDEVSKKHVGGLYSIDWGTPVTC